MKVFLEKESKNERDFEVSLYNFTRTYGSKDYLNLFKPRTIGYFESYKLLKTGTTKPFTYKDFN